MTLKSSFKRAVAVVATIGIIGVGVAVGASSASAADRLEGPLVISGVPVATTHAFISENVVGAPVRTISAFNVTDLTPLIPSAGTWTLPAKGTQGPVMNSFGLCLDYNATVQVCDGSSTQQWKYFINGFHGLVTVDKNLGLQASGDRAMVAKFPASSDWYLHTNFLSDVVPIADVAITSPTAGASVGTTIVVVTGTAEPNSTVNITVGGVTVGTTTSNAAGNWSATVAGPLTPGSVTLTATAAGKSASVTVNAVAPVMANVVITAPTSGAAISTKNVTVSGTAQPNSTVNITVGGVQVGTTTSNASGAWSAVVAGPLTPGDVTFTATAAGKNASVTAKAYDFAITTPVESADVATVGTLKVEVSGISKPNAVVVLTDADGTALGTTTADANGKWTTFVKLVPEGRHTIVATSGDDTDSVKVVSSTAFDGPVINPTVALGALAAAGAVGMGFTLKRRRQLTDAV